MEHAAYERWWNLHVRVARGDDLSAEERALYEAGQRGLDQDEKLRELSCAVSAREELRAAQSQHAQLERRRQQLDAEIAALEKLLDQETRQVLGVEEP